MGRRSHDAEGNRGRRTPVSDSSDPAGGPPAGVSTRLVGAGRRPEWTGAPGVPGSVVNPPVWRASTHLYGQHGGAARRAA